MIQVLVLKEIIYLKATTQLQFLIHPQRDVHNRYLYNCGTTTTSTKFIITQPTDCDNVNSGTIDLQGDWWDTHIHLSGQMVIFLKI